MSPSPSVIGVLSAHAADFRACFGVRKLGVPGSCARGDQKPASDADILVEFTGVDLDTFMDLEFLLEDRLGRPVDLAIESAVKPALRESILRDVRNVA